MFYSSVESREKRSKEEVEGEKEADGKIPQKIKEKKAKSSIRYHSDLWFLTTIYHIKRKLFGKNMTSWHY